MSNSSVIHDREMAARAGITPHTRIMDGYDETNLSLETLGQLNKQAFRVFPRSIVPVAISYNVQLPFVGTGGLGSWWNVPLKGGYSGGKQTGKAMAISFLKFRASEHYQGVPVLHHIAFSMLLRRENARSEEEKDAIDGQLTGFFSCICEALQGSLDAYLSIPDSAIVEAASAGLEGRDYA